MTHKPLLSTAPDYSSVDSPFLLVAPTTFRVGDHFNTFALSTGYSLDLQLPAYGEFIERRLFQLHPKASSKKQLPELPEDVSERLSFMLQQTCGADLRDSLQEHVFEMAYVHKLLTGERTEIPSVTITLAAHPDGPYVPNRDSCGCAAHTDPSVCFEKSLLEFAERQSLVACWALDHYRTRLSWFESQLDKLGAVGRIVQLLQRNGTLFLADISAFEGCHVVLAAYSSNDPGTSIKFSVGCAAHMNIWQAASKAVVEMYQAGILMGSLHDPQRETFYSEFRRGLEPYSRYFGDSNSPDTALKFAPFRVEDGTNIDKAARVGSVPELLAELTSISSHIFYYSDSVQLGDRILTVGKVLSPDFFLHMDVSAACNIDNKFARRLGYPEVPMRREPLPFA